MVAQPKVLKAEKQSDVLDELKQLTEDNGGILKPEVVVEFAEDPNTALHSRFEWDDKKAGHEYRLWQARELITVFVTVLHEDLPESNVWVSLKSDRYSKEDRGGYRLMVDVLNDESLSEQLLDDAYKDWQIFKKKYQGLKKLVKAFDEMDKAFQK